MWWRGEFFVDKRENIGRGRDRDIWESPGWTRPDLAVYVRKGGGEGRREIKGEPGAAARRPKLQMGRVTKMSELYREEPLEEE